MSYNKISIKWFIAKLYFKKIIYKTSQDTHFLWGQFIIVLVNSGNN
jgi:hypothetical protein